MTLHRKFFRRLRRTARSERGAAIVELAVALPVLILVAVGAAEYGRMYFTAITVANAARAGAQYGARDGYTTKIAEISAAVLNDAGDVSGVLASPAPTSFCRCPDETAASCTDANACGLYGESRVFVQASAQKTVTFLMKYPGMPASITITRTATFRAR